MRGVVVAGVAIAACSAQHAAQTDAPPVMPDACPVAMSGPTADIDDCVPGGLAPLDIDGTWHMQGSATTWTDDGSGSATSTSAIDEYVTIHRDGCFAGMAEGSAEPMTDDKTYATATALAHDCYYLPECPRGTITWSICVGESDGALRYRRDESQQHLTMHWGGTSFATLTR